MTAKEGFAGKSPFKLFSSLVLCLGTGMAGSFFTRASLSEWYLQLQKPWFNPPGWIFGPVWTVLYIMMGLSLYLVWSIPETNAFRRRSLWIFAIQLFLNFSWSVAFFGFRNPGLGLGVILLLILSISLNIYYFSKISKAASFLLCPYLGWVLFASVLNFSIWNLNH